MDNDFKKGDIVSVFIHGTTEELDKRVLAIVIKKDNTGSYVSHLGDYYHIKFQDGTVMKAYEGALTLHERVPMDFVNEHLYKSFKLSTEELNCKFKKDITSLIS